MAYHAQTETLLNRISPQAKAIRAENARLLVELVTASVTNSAVGMAMTSPISNAAGIRPGSLSAAFATLRSVTNEEGVHLPTACRRRPSEQWVEDRPTTSAGK